MSLRQGSRRDLQGSVVLCRILRWAHEGDNVGGRSLLPLPKRPILTLVQLLMIAQR